MKIPVASALLRLALVLLQLPGGWGQNLRWRGAVHHYFNTVDQLGLNGDVHRAGNANSPHSRYLNPWHSSTTVLEVQREHQRVGSFPSDMLSDHPPAHPPPTPPWGGPTTGNVWRAGHVPVYAPTPPPQHPLHAPTQPPVGGVHVSGWCGHGMPHQVSPQRQAPSSHAQLQGWAMQGVAVQDSTGSGLQDTAFCVKHHGSVPTQDPWGGTTTGNPHERPPRVADKVAPYLPNSWRSARVPAMAPPPPDQGALHNASTMPQGSCQATLQNVPPALDREAQPPHAAAIFLPSAVTMHICTSAPSIAAWGTEVSPKQRSWQGGDPKLTGRNQSSCNHQLRIDRNVTMLAPPPPPQHCLSSEVAANGSLPCRHAVVQSGSGEIVQISRHVWHDRSLTSTSYHSMKETCETRHVEPDLGKGMLGDVCHCTAIDETNGGSVTWGSNHLATFSPAASGWASV